MGDFCQGMVVKFGGGGMVENWWFGLYIVVMDIGCCVGDKVDIFFVIIVVANMILLPV